MYQMEMAQTKQPETVTTSYVAERLHCSLAHVALLCRQGKLKAIKPLSKWLVVKEDFDAKMGKLLNTERANEDDGATNFDI